MTTTDDFERHRQYLTGLAYRLIGEVSEAEDMVQETFLRWDRAGRPPLDHPRAWFVRTCTRLCLDRLKSAQRRRESYPGEWLPEPLVTEDDASARTELDESLGMALLTTIERLRPAERAVFLLHDVFDYSFREVAEILELSPANCRQLGVRARRGLDAARSRRPADRATVERLSNAFLDALRGGDLAGLHTVLAEDVVLRADGGGKAVAAGRPIEGRSAVASFFENIFMKRDPPPGMSVEHVTFNGAPGLLVLDGGAPVTAFHFHVDAGEISGIYAMRNPDKLRVFV